MEKLSWIFKRKKQDVEVNSQGSDVDELADAPPFDAAPNVSLNVHGVSKLSDQLFAAVSGLVMQLGVLVFAGITVYHPTLKENFQKGGSPVQRYAFPLMACGTISLCIGVVLCAAVVDHGTEEWELVPIPIDTPDSKSEHRPGLKNTPARILWIQPQHNVSDQKFDSHILFARHKRAVEAAPRILMSRRTRKKEDAIFQKYWALQSIVPTKMHLWTVTGVSFGLFGFIAQFIGLRALNWSASITQLTALAAMTIIRAWLRRHLVLNPIPVKVPNDHQLDWLAMRIAESDESNGEGNDCEWWLADEKEIHPGTKELSHPFEWKILTGYLPDRTDSQQRDNHHFRVERILALRKRLGDLTEIKGPMSSLAVSVAVSISKVLNALVTSDEQQRISLWSQGLNGFLSLHPQYIAQYKIILANERSASESFEWRIKASLVFRAADSVPGSNAQNHKGPKNEFGELVFSAAKMLGKNGKRWRVNSTDLGAALSLWLYNVQREGMPEKLPLQNFETASDWIQRETSTHEILADRLCIVQSANLKMPVELFFWWVSAAVPSHTSELEFMRHDYVNDSSPYIRSEDGTFLFGIARSMAIQNSLSHLESAGDLLLPDPERTSCPVHTTQRSYMDLKNMLAQHLLMGFMEWCAPSANEALLGKASTIRRIDQRNTPIHTNSRLGWFRHNYLLAGMKIENRILVDLATAIAQTGLGTSSEAYLCLVPSLFANKKLSLGALVDAVRLEALPLEKKAQF